MEEEGISVYGENQRPLCLVYGDKPTDFSYTISVLYVTEEPQYHDRAQEVLNQISYLKLAKTANPMIAKVMNIVP